MADERRGQDDIRRRAEQASAGEVAAGLEAEEEASLEASQPRRKQGRPEGESDGPDLSTPEQRQAQSRRIEEMQRSGEGIHGVSTEGRGSREGEEQIREARSGEDRED